MTGADIVEKTREFIGVPFRHWGRNRNGVDCVGLVIAAAHELGITQYEPPPYSRLVDPERLRKQLEQACFEVSFQELEPGDVLLLKVLGLPVHLGIYTGETLIHAFETAGRVVEVNFSEYWHDRIEAAFRWKGLG
jgi:cell wall-associated NlpC family hydrolase